ncbi:MAG: hypothetical protein ACTHU0_08880 [Kofleriaceae bacterium]
MADPDGDVWLDGQLLAGSGRVRALALSPTGSEALVVRDDARAVLVWTRESAPIAITDEGGRDCVDAAFVVRDREPCVAIAYRHELVLHRLEASIATRQPLGGLAVASLHPVAGGTALAILGAEFGESRDTAVLLEASEVPVAGPTIERRFRFIEGLVDSADLLAVGPAGPDEVVLFRDSDGEELLDEEDAGAIVPREWGLTGWYVATRSGETRQRFAWGEKVARGAQVAASARYVALGIRGAIHVISRADARHERLELAWLSTTMTGEHILARSPDGALELLGL